MSAIYRPGNMVCTGDTPPVTERTACWGKATPPTGSLPSNPMRRRLLPWLGDIVRLLLVAS
jgi:hypothetical protein